MSKEQKWAAGDNDEWFTSELLDSREEAIQYVKDEFDGDGYIGRADEITIQGLVDGAVHIDSLIESIEEYAYEEIGEASDDLLVLSPAKKKALEEQLRALLVAELSISGVKYKVANPIECIADVPEEL